MALSGLEDVYLDLSQNVYPDVFAETHTETVNIIRAVATKDAFGGETDVDTTVNAFPVPCTVKPLNGNAFYTEGGAWTIYSIQMPKYQQGTFVDLQRTDRLQMLDADGNVQLTFQINDIRNRNKSGLFFDLICALKN